MQGAPYRQGHAATPPGPIWWAGWIARAALVVSGLLWIGMLVAAYHRETWGMIGARIAIGRSAFAIGALVFARRTRYAPSAAARVVAPLAVGWLCGWICVGALELFFATLWSVL